MSQSPENETTSIDADPGVAFRISARDAALFILLVTAAALGSRFLDADQVAGSALKVVTATLVVGIVPGALATLLWRPRPQLSALEVVGFGIALSFGVVHLLTMLAVSAHVSPVFILAGLGIASALMAGRLIYKGSGAVVVSIDELIVLALLFVLAVPLYLQGSPFDAYEDQVLASIARRLSELQSPRLDNLYVAPGIVYTYPFPSALYFMGLIARLGDIDPLFVYHKLRFFWGPAALVMLYLAARASFGYAAVACAVTVTAAVFICSGVFGMVAGFPAWWGQLVPYTYVPDVAMTVLLPALLVVAFEYLQSGSTRERVFFFAATAMLVLMLTVIHIREIVQFAAYLGCFIVVTAAVRAFRPYLRPAASLLALTLVVAAVYIAWQAAVVPVVDDIVAEQRAELVSTAAAIPLSSLIFSPAPAVLGDFVQDFDQIFGGLIPFFLFTGTIVVLVFRRRPLVWLISSSTLAYLAVMSVPLLAIPYIYLTYFEILHIPVRNVIFFVYLLAGALIYVTVVALARIDRSRVSLVLTGTIGGALALLATLSLNRSLEGFFVPLMAAYALTFLYLGVEASGGLKASGYHWKAVALLVSILALVALWPARSPVPRTEQVSVRWTSGLEEARRVALEAQFSLMDAEPKPDATDEENVWNYRLRDRSVDNVRRIVTHPDVRDTQHIDRSTFTVEAQPPPPGDHPVLGVLYVTWIQYPGMVLLIGTAVLVWVLGLVVPAVIASARGSQAVSSIHTAMSQPFYRFALPYVLFIIPFAFWSARPTLSPLDVAPMPPAGRADTPQAMIAQIPCVTTPRMPARFAEEEVVLPERTICPPDYAVMEWARTHVPVEGVFAVDRWTPYPPPVFMAQQAVVFPTLDASFIHEDSLFRDYYRVFDERIRRYRVQPFFNAVETPDERAAFVAALGVTHVLVSPVHYDELRPVLDALPQQFALRYDNARWAVYEATRASN